MFMALSERAYAGAYEGNYYHAYCEAVRKMAAQDPILMAERSGAQYHSEEKRFSLKYCGQQYYVSFPGGEVWLPGRQQVPISDRTLLVLYLTMASGLPLRGQWLAFIELPGGPHHHAPFMQEAAQPIAQVFGHNPDLLIHASKQLGGNPITMGDKAVVIPALPRIPLAVVLWRADEEFPAKATVLFDASAPTYLDTAALFVLGINCCLKLVQAAYEIICRYG
ncbi:MAG: hypothetical protein PWP65_626 [Clostridia bacterium]|nr:hypothetical protein [Clostridia bacterium]